MKTTIILGLIMLVTLSFSFHTIEKEKEPLNADSNRVNDTVSEPQTAVNLDVAQESIRRYVRIAGELYTHNNASQDSIVRAFTIPSTDLLGVLGKYTSNCDSTKYKYTSCRVYLGLDSIPIAKGSFLFKNRLFMIPVDSNNLDVNMFYRTINVDTKDTTITQFVYDLITPCPKTCDELSPLYIKLN